MVKISFVEELLVRRLHKECKNNLEDNLKAPSLCPNVTLRLKTATKQTSTTTPTTKLRIIITVPCAVTLHRVSVHFCKETASLSYLYFQESQSSALPETILPVASCRLPSTHERWLRKFPVDLNTIRRLIAVCVSRELGNSAISTCRVLPTEFLGLPV